MVSLQAVGDGGATQISSSTSSVVSTSIYQIFKKSVAWLSDPRNPGIILNGIICAGAAYELISGTFSYQVCLDAAAHGITVLTYLCPTKEGTAIGVVANTVRGVWIQYSVATGEKVVPLILQVIDGGIHLVNNFIYLNQPESPSLFEKNTAKVKSE